MKINGETVCAIIKTCAESNVARFKWGAIEVSFKNAEPHHFGSVSFDDPKFQEVVSAETLLKEELAHRDEQLAQMEIEDPLAYEKAIESGDLIDSKAGDGLNEENSGPE
jgi:hypothetical protein